MTREEAIFHLTEARKYPVAYTPEEQEAYEMAIAALREQPRWIPVEERLPERFASVLICTESGEVGETVKSEWSKSGWVWSGYDGEDIEEKVTHWMPLPEPPKEEV